MEIADLISPQGVVANLRVTSKKQADQIDPRGNRGT